MSRLVSLLGLLFAIGLATPAFAQATSDEGRARAMFLEGADKLERGDARGAVPLLEGAYAISPYAVVLYNLGLAYEALGDPVRAVGAMSKVIAAPGKLKPERLERAKRTVADQSKKIGSLVVETNAPGATILVGEETLSPGKPHQLAAGSAFVSVEAPGHAPAHQRVTVEPGKTVTTRVDLASNEKVGLVKIMTDLLDADVVVDGVPVAKTPLSAPLAIPAGTHRVELRRDGYVTAGEPVTVVERGLVELALAPALDRDRVRLGGARLRLSLVPADASVRVDGARMELAEGGAPIPPGRHRLTIERTGYDAMTLDVIVPAGATIARTIALAPLPEERARRRGKAETTRAAAYGVGAAGIVVAGAAIGVLVWNRGNQSEIDALRADERAEVDDFAVCRTSTEDDLKTCSARRADLFERDETADGLDVAMPITLAIGTAGIVTGIVLLATGDDPASFDLAPSDEWGVLPMVTPRAGGFTLGVHGAF